MDIKFVGAAREVTGSCHLLHVDGRTVALDCGLFQGHRADAAAKNRLLPIDVAALDAVVLSHAHIDHAGRLPFLVHEGYRNTIWATPATRDLCAIMLADSAHIQQKDAEHLQRHGRAHEEPLYAMRDVAQTMDAMVAVPYHHPFDVVPGVRATFVDAGHILGSASVVVDCTEGGVTKRLVFSGDIGRAGLPIIRDPEFPEGADAVIMESTYGNREHGTVPDARLELGRVVRETAARGGRVLVPAFAVGRVQELVYDLHALARDGAIPSIPIYIDSPLAVDATAVFELHPEVFDRDEALLRDGGAQVFRFDLVHYARDVEDSKALSARRGAMVIISPSGMAESGRILHHLAQDAPDPRNTILIVGFQAEHTLGRRIVERRPMLRVFGDEVPLRAHVEVINGYSAHAGRSELLSWIGRVQLQSPRLSRVWLVHGEPEAQDALRPAVAALGLRVEAPEPGSRVEL
jgi:metallo-beta-lactamase family protein